MPEAQVAYGLEFLKVIGGHLPERAKTYTGAVDRAQGDAYAEPAKDFEGYISCVKGRRRGGALRRNGGESAAICFGKRRQINCIGVARRKVTTLSLAR
jgi:hypothetical protein